MRILKYLTAAIVSLAFLLIVGVVEIKAMAMSDGLVLDAGGSVAGIAEQASPILQRLAVLVMCLVIFWIAMRLNSPHSRGQVIILGATLLLSSLITHLVPTLAVADIYLIEGRFLGWFISGGQSPAIQVLGGILIIYTTVQKTSKKK